MNGDDSPVTAALARFQLETLRSFFVGEPSCEVAGPDEIASFLPQLFRPGEVRLAACGFSPLGYLLEQPALCTAAVQLSAHCVYSDGAATIARQIEVGRSSPALPTLITFETHLADGVMLTTLDGMEATLHLTKLSRIHHSRALTLEALYQAHRQAVRECGVATANAPPTLAKVAAADREYGRRRRIELEQSGLLETAPDNVRRFRRSYLASLVKDWMQSSADYGRLNALRVEAELALNPNPPPLPAAYLAQFG